MKYAIYTLGCKVNQFETQALETLLGERGLTPAADGDSDIDVIIINTCAVTAESVRKSRQAVRRMKQHSPGALTVVCGCFSQLSPDKAAALGADIVYGSGHRRELVDDIMSALSERKSLVNVDEPFRRTSFEQLPAGSLEGRTRAYMKIQDGCENFCSYCVIPFARGRVLSMPPEAAARQAAGLQEHGYKEIVVTGIEIASYGKDLGGSTGLADVVAAIAEAAPQTRIRLGSLEPTIVTEEFCAKLAVEKNICRHFHLSLQSGCDKTLRNMRRKYDTARFYESVELLRRYFPGCGLTADLITGFPGETVTDHNETLAFIRKCAFSGMHVFPYSRRPGTRAAAMAEQLTQAVKSERAQQAQAVADEMRREFLLSCVGKTLPVLFERQGRDGLWHGHADNYCETAASGENLHSIVKNVKIESVRDKILIGKIID